MTDFEKLVRAYGAACFHSTSAKEMGEALTAVLSAAGASERADAEKDAALLEAVEHTIATLKRQIDLIAERAPGNFLDKTPVVRSLRAHQSRLERAILAANGEKK